MSIIVHGGCKKGRINHWQITELAESLALSPGVITPILWGYVNNYIIQRKILTRKDVRDDAYGKNRARHVG